MNFLDIRTLLFGSVISYAICAAVIGAFWYQNRKHSPELIFWFADFILEFLAISFYALRGSIPDFFSIILSGAFIIGGTVLLYIGMERYIGKPTSQSFNIILVSAFILVNIFFTYIQPSLLARNLNFSVALFIICFECAWLLLHRVNKEFKEATQKTGVVFIVFCLISLIRIYANLRVPPGSELFQSGLADALVILAYQMMFIGLTFTLTRIVTNRIHLDLENDIQKREQSEEALRESEERFRNIFENSPISMYQSTPEGKLVNVNLAYANMLGYSSTEEIIHTVNQTSLAEVVYEDPSIRKELIEEVEKAQGKWKGFNTHYKRKDGQIIGVIVYFSEQKESTSEQSFLYGCVQDMTEQERATEALKQERIFTDAIFASIPGLLYLYDEAGYLIRWNKRHEEITGYSANELDHFYILNWYKDEPQDIARITQGIQKALSEGYAQAEANLITKSGTKILFDFTALRLYLGGKAYFAGIGIDVTNRRQTENQIQTVQEELKNLLAESERSRRALLSLNEDQKAAEEVIRELNVSLEKRVAERTAQLEASNKELEAFAYSVSHDLRAPLRAINGYSQILQQEFAQHLDEEGTRLLNNIRINATKMDNLITSLLALTRVSRSQLNFLSIDMTTLVKLVIDEVASAEVQEKFTFTINELPAAYGDPTLIHQVWANLISNAIKYTMPKEERKIEISGFANEGECTYVIRDNGVGFDQKYVDRLFHLFQRLHKETEFDGTGVGLAIVQNIISRHGGKVWAEGEVGTGAAFYFTIPVRQK